MLIEMLGAKGGAMKGKRVDGTAFCNPSVDELSKILHACGYNKYGDEDMIDGITGCRLKGAMFMGLAYYQRLRHMVQDKIHSRGAQGPRSMINRQPPSGRSNGGGHRVVSTRHLRDKKNTLTNTLYFFSASRERWSQQQ